MQRGSVRYGGRPIKWLGDGVMFYFRDPGTGVRAALEMVDELAAGEVLVSQAVADASQENGIIFRDIGPAELKGVSGTMHLLRANLA
jgi:class 3 adenylate cyclase